MTRPFSTSTTTTRQPDTRSAPDQTPAPPVRVAVADDDPLAQAAIEAMLGSDDSVVVVGVCDGVDEIAQLAARECPDVVVLDWMMPRGGGPDAARAIATRNSRIGIVGLSSSDQPEAQLDMLRAGADCFVVKGGRSTQLVHAVHQAFERAHRRGA